VSRRCPAVAEPGQLFRISGSWGSEPKWVARAINQRTVFVVTSVTNVNWCVHLLDPVEGYELSIPPHLMPKLRRVS
jgi:hypothetical protein